MASAIAHALIGGAIGLLATRQLEPTPPRVALTGEFAADLAQVRRQCLYRWLPWVGALVAVAPDADVLMHAFVRYSDPLGHRGAFHSLAFYALAAAALAYLPLFSPARLKSGLCLFLCMSSHSLLDMLTNGGYGVGLFWPLSNERLFWPWRPIPVSPLSIGAFFSAQGLRILSYELPLTLPVFLYALWKRRSDSAGGPSDINSGSANSDETADDQPPRDDHEDETAADETEYNEDGVAVMAIEDSIDLHHFAPRDILDVVDAYLEAAAEKGFEEVRLIHGRGKGVQRARIRKLLETHPLVESFKDAPHTRGGWGATLVWLRRGG